VELALDEGEPLSKIAKKLKIKLTTARLIIAKYKRTGEFPMR
jgi:transposase